MTFDESAGRKLPSCVRESGTVPGEDARSIDEDVSTAYYRSATNVRLEKWTTAGNNVLINLSDY
ncbi:hypothetical protein [Levilactobacillus fujinensis]|uniref:hypothetical protein n=1 Tax=Levilactobacillus fujinensis TaxID=2486024 RepID=UPI0036D3FE6C